MLDYYVKWGHLPMSFCRITAYPDNMSTNANFPELEKAPNTDAQIGERVHQLMWQRRVTQKGLGKEMGLTQATVSRKLRGERTWYPDELILVARLFNVTVGHLFGETEKDPAAKPGPSSESLHTESNRRPFHYYLNSNVHSLSERRMNKRVRRA